MTNLNYGIANFGDQRFIKTAARHYVWHEKQGVAMREIAREMGCHASTISRQINKIKRLRDKPEIRAMIRKLEQQPVEVYCSTQRDEYIEHAIELLQQDQVFLVHTQGVQNALIVRPDVDGGLSEMARVRADTLYKMILRGDLLEVHKGKVSRYILAPRLRAYKDDEKTPQKIETPLSILARRKDVNGKSFLTRDMVNAGYRMNEDFQLYQMDQSIETDWQSVLQKCTKARPIDPRGRVLHRLGQTLNELGPGLGEIAFRCCCKNQGLEAAEREMGWSARSGKIVLRIALERLVRYYNETDGPGGGQIG